MIAAWVLADPKTANRSKTAYLSNWLGTTEWSAKVLVVFPTAINPNLEILPLRLFESVGIGKGWK